MTSRCRLLFILLFAMLLPGTLWAVECSVGRYTITANNDAIDAKLNGVTTVSAFVAHGNYTMSELVTAINAAISPLSAQFVASANVPDGRFFLAFSHPTSFGPEYFLLAKTGPNVGRGIWSTIGFAEADYFEFGVPFNGHTFGSNLPTKPFGNIDTPLTGATVSGTIQIWGWVLSPQPGIMDFSGTGVDLSIDMTATGLTPLYNLYRSDIPLVHPGYPNTLGAVFRFLWNSASVTDGPHSINVFAVDGLGRTALIGSKSVVVDN
jgi:hypothetical protein